jgi:hypothetical protein
LRDPSHVHGVRGRPVHKERPDTSIGPSLPLLQRWAEDEFGTREFVIYILQFSTILVAQFYTDVVNDSTHRYSSCSLAKWMIRPLSCKDHVGFYYTLIFDDLSTINVVIFQVSQNRIPLDHLLLDS